MVITKTYNELRPVLMDKATKGIKTPYYLMTDKDQVIFVISSGLNGSEFNKTSGCFNNFSGIQTLQCLYGSGILLMQRNDEFEEAKEFKMVRLSPHKQVDVPVGWLVCLVNTGSGLLVVIESNHLDEKYKIPKPILDKKGFAYYVVEKKGEIVFEPNPNYNIRPQVTAE